MGAKLTERVRQEEERESVKQTAEEGMKEREREKGGGIGAVFFLPHAWI
jgi:hypothetical protein